MIDDEDRKTIGTGVIRVAVFAFLVLMGATIAGLALRVFQIVSGI